MIDIDIISGFLRIIDHETEIIYGIFNLTKFDTTRIYRVQKLIQQNIEKVSISINPFNKTTELYIGNKITIKKSCSNSLDNNKNEIVDLFI